MSWGTKSLAVLGAVAGAAVAGAPLAHAHGADAVINDLQAEGYLVNINWVNGSTQHLSDCTVVRVNNPSSNPEPMPGDTVYVDVSCPNSLY
jgi:hypothetical protein